MDTYSVDNLEEQLDVTFRSVSQLNMTIKQKIKRDPQLGRTFSVIGELSNVSFGIKDCYFSLKDSSSVIDGVVWEYRNTDISRDSIKNGDKVIVYGTVEVWNNKGKFKLTATAIQPIGEGAIMARVRALQARLTAEGIFDEAHKKPIPAYPRIIGLITGQDSDAYYDIITKSFERNEHIRFVVRYSLMQGVNAPADIVSSIRQLDPMGLDVIVIARGGGDTEDRWTFHDEAIVRAIYNANTPIVTAIGHTRNGNHLADLVADRSVYVPKAFADDVIINLGEKLEQLDKYLKDYSLLVRGKLSNLRLTADNCLGRLQVYSPKNQVDRKRAELDGIRNQISGNLNMKVERYKGFLNRSEARLQGQTPVHKLNEKRQLVAQQEQQLTANINAKLVNYQNYADNIELKIKAKNPRIILDKRKQEYEVVKDKLKLTMDQKLLRYTNDFVYISTRLDGLSPTSKLINGFGYISTNGEPVRAGGDVAKGDKISITLKKSEITATVDDVKNNVNILEGDK